MADEIFTNALGGIIMLLIILGYLIYLRVQRYRGGVITRLESRTFSAMCLISFLTVLVYYMRTQVL
jgi:tellurite resistance protein TehA-like permease